MAYPTAPSSSPGPELEERELPAEWNELTERIELPCVTHKFLGFGETDELKLERVGCVAEAQIHVIVKFAVPAKEVLPKIGAPWSLIKKVALKANGVSGIISCSATVLKVREIVEYRSPPDSLATSVTPKTKLKESETATWEFVLQVPIAQDLRELDGIVLAQSEETALGIEIQFATLAEVFESGGTELTAITGSVKWAVTLFSIGTMTEGKNTVVVLPDLTSLHGLVERSAEYANEGEVEAPLTRTSGDLLRYFVSAWKGLVATFDPKFWTSFIIQFGGNQKPIGYNDPVLLARRNERDYLGRPTVNGVAFAVLDTQLDDAERDAIRPMALSELKSLIGIPEAPGANSSIKSTQETLYPANA